MEKLKDNPEVAEKVKIILEMADTIEGKLKPLEEDTRLSNLPKLKLLLDSLRECLRVNGKFNKIDNKDQHQIDWSNEVYWYGEFVFRMKDLIKMIDFYKEKHPNTEAYLSEPSGSDGRAKILDFEIRLFGRSTSMEFLDFSWE